MSKYSYDPIRRLLKDGYPYEIIGNDGFRAVLVDLQPLVNQDHAAIYRYPVGDAVHCLWEIRKYFTVVRQLPDDWEE